MVGIPQFSEFLAQNWRYKDGTTRDCSFMFSVVPDRALRCDRCLVITTGSNRSALFHGDNLRSTQENYRRDIEARYNFGTTEREKRWLADP
jgi:hypothetical protein